MERKSIIISDNEQFLRQVSNEVDFDDQNLKENLKDLEIFCLANELFALAAIQIGIPKRIIYLKNTTLNIPLGDKAYNEGQVLINPKILNRKGHTRFWEACVSCLDNMGLVNRPYKFKIEYQDENGNINIKTFIGFEATVLSHEFDHLNGTLHIDIADEIIVMPKEERKKYRKEHPYEIISKDCDFEEVVLRPKSYTLRKH